MAQKKEGIGSLDILRILWPVLGSAFIILGAYHGLTSYLDARIESRIEDADFLQKLARHVRPSLVFDDKGSIIADIGAAQYIEEMGVSKGPRNTLEIVVSPREFLGIEPVLEPLDDRYAIRAERGTKYDWVFTLQGIDAIVAEGSGKPTRQRFRLELIR
jgi:hypothetical protein